MTEKCTLCETEDAIVFFQTDWKLFDVEKDGSLNERVDFKKGDYANDDVYLCRGCGEAEGLKAWLPKEVDAIVPGLYVVERLGGGIGIRAAPDLETAKANHFEEVGTDGFGPVRPATESDVNWVKGMGGYVPEIIVPGGE